MSVSLPTHSFSEFKKDEIERSIPDRFERQVAKYPHRLAVKTGNHALTYDALNRAANRLARAVLEQRGEGEEPVALLFDQGAAAITAILAALKAGKIYVPLDPTSPRAKISSVLQDSQAGLVVSDGKNLRLAGELIENVINIDRLDSNLSDGNPSLSLPPDTLAYILYTSGSTGEPKGVVHNHRNVLHFIRNYTNDLGVGADDRQSLLFSYTVAGSVKNIFGALLNGATLLPFNLKEEGPARLSAWLTEEAVTLCQMVPTVFRHFVSDLAGTEMFPALRVLYLTGEPLLKRDVEMYRAHFPASCLLVNALASTELNTVRQYFIDKGTEISGSVAPVGYAVEDTEILLLDETGAAVGPGLVGEIAIKSRYLSLGYWRKPDLTGEVFFPDPDGGDRRTYRTSDLGRMRPDGCLEYLGRKDFQVKIRGHRIEVGEIEEALLALGTIKQAAVAAEGDLAAGNRLIAYIVSNENPPPTVSTLRRALAEKLPDYMVPSAFFIVESLPVSAIGKVDVQALPAAGNARPAEETPFVAPRTSIEAALAKIWAETLGKERVGIHDNFFDLGGHSLSATQILSRTRDLLDVEMPLNVLFEKPTIAKLAEHLKLMPPGTEAR